jgi:diguanylate cyclase (GGDEF)-like protein
MTQPVIELGWSMILRLQETSAHAVLNALSGSIAVLDANGIIVGVNDAWRRFAKDNGCADEAYYVGTDYLEVCARALAQSGDPFLDELIRRLRGILTGQQLEFSAEYPCHSPAGERWFQLTATAIDSAEGGGMVVYHQDITTRVHADAELHRAKEAVEAAGRDLAEVLIRERTLARIDSLTGAINRRRFFELAEYEVTVAARYGRQLSIVLFDLDGFKAINDHVGHQAGDELLKGVVRVVTAHLGQDDVLARYGGDEFVLMLPHTGASEAAVIAERIRADVADQTVTDARGKTLSTRISAGIAAFRGSGDSLDALIHRADSALYEAKKRGRNRVVVHPRDASPQIV